MLVDLHAHFRCTCCLGTSDNRTTTYARIRASDGRRESSI